MWQSMYLPSVRRTRQKCKWHTRGPSSNKQGNINDRRKIFSNSFLEILKGQKYYKPVAINVNMGQPTFTLIEWESHADDLIWLEYTPLLKLKWDQHPTQLHLDITKQHASKLCHLYEEIYLIEHFISSRYNNTNKRYQKLSDKL